MEYRQKPKQVLTSYHTVEDVNASCHICTRRSGQSMERRHGRYTAELPPWARSGYQGRRRQGLMQRDTRRRYSSSHGSKHLLSTLLNMSLHHPVYGLSPYDMNYHADNEAFPILCGNLDCDRDLIKVN